MKKNLILVFLLLLPFIGVEALQHEKPSEVLGTQVIPIQDTQSNRQYELYIKLPEGYSKNSDVKYPTIYVTDAEPHFKIVFDSNKSLMKDVILVGVSYQKGLSAGASRVRDFTPAKPKNASRRTGQASNHLAFFRNDVIKYVEDNYRADPNRRSYYGYSLGGLFGAYILVVQPDTFKNYILGSPSLGFNNRYMLELESNMAKKRKDINANVFVSVGALEKSYIKPIENFISSLKRRNYPNLSLEELVIFKSSDHYTAFPMSITDSLNWLSNLIKE